MLIIVCGLPGSGKSTLARALARRRGAAILSSDLVRKRMFPNPTYSEDEKERVYGEMASLCREALEKGGDVVADATFYRRSQRERFAALAAGAGTSARFILCTLPQDEVKRRLGRRERGGPSDADFAVHMRLRQEFEPLSGDFLEVDSGLPLRLRLEKADKFLGEGHG